MKNHLSSILSKMSVRDRMQAVLKAKELGIRVVNERELAEMIEEARTHSFETIKFF